jgi:hypothetical protein
MLAKQSPTHSFVARALGLGPGVAPPLLVLRPLFGAIRHRSVVDLGVYIEVGVSSRQGIPHELELSTVTAQPPEQLVRVDVAEDFVNVSEG